MTPDDEHLYRRRADAEKTLGKLHRALADINRAIELSPAPYKLYIQRGLILYDMKDWAGAIASYDEAIRLDPEHGDAYWHRYMARPRRSRADIRKAQADLEKHFSLPTRLIASAEQMIKEMKEAPPCEMENAGDRVDAYTDLIGYNEEDPGIWFARGHAYAQMDACEEAERDFTRATELAPNDADAWAARSDTYHSMGEYKKAVADADRAIALAPTYARAYIARGYGRGAQGSLRKAKADFAKALSLDQSYLTAEAYNGRGAAYWHKRKYRQAVRDFSRAIDASGVNPLFHKNRALVQRLRGRHREAIADLKRAIQLDRLDPSTYWTLGLAYADTGQSTMALAKLNRSIVLGEEDPDVYSDRAWIWFEKKDYARAREDIRLCREKGGTPDPKLLKKLRKAAGPGLAGP
jgi:tetratricopeptide (TPR) repeat protein